MSDTRVLLIGVGGLGTATSRVLLQSGIRRLTLLDDDVVDQSNLHRQLLFQDRHIGTPKIEAAAEVLHDLHPGPNHLALMHDRFVPENAMKLAKAHDIIVEGADNLATKFLAADAAHLAGIPIVQAGVVQWNGWALGHAPQRGSCCLRCVFEGMPSSAAANCEQDGVIGPAVGVVAALQAALTLDLLKGESGSLWTYAGLQGIYRRLKPTPRADCALCTGKIHELSLDLYGAPACER